MHIKHLQETQKKRQLKTSDFYTPGGIHVYFKEPLHSDDIDPEKVVAEAESIVPPHLLSEIEMIIVGWFDEFEERELTAFYESGTIFLSYMQNDEESMLDNIIHEISHSLETPNGYLLYGDHKLKDEFLRKRKYLHDILWAKNFKAPESFFMNPEYDKEFDMFLYEKVGYDKLVTLMQGLFISPYAATSLREYFATGFSEFFMHSDHKFFKKVSPQLYQKLIMLQDPEKT
jgi:Mlc titration factor MtfA (ptsG expression regulator)